MKTKFGVDYGEEIEQLKGSSRKEEADEMEVKKESKIANGGFFFTIEGRDLAHLTFHSPHAEILIYLWQKFGRWVEVDSLRRARELPPRSKDVIKGVRSIVDTLGKTSGVKFDSWPEKSTSAIKPKPSQTDKNRQKTGIWRIATDHGEFVLERKRSEVRVYCREVTSTQRAQLLLARAFRETLSEADDELLARVLHQLKIQQVHSLILKVIRASDLNCEFDASSVCCVLGNRNIATGNALSEIWEGCRALHQLPAPPLNLVGRDEDLHQLRGRQEVQGTLYVALRGMPGIGKTTLAIALANEWKPRFPDAQLVLDGRGGTANPLSAARLLATAVFALRPELRLLYDETTVENSRVEFEGLYRDILSDKKALILVDNVLDATQVESLMPPVGCALLVASRERFLLHNTPPYLVGKLSDEKAADLLRGLYASLRDEESHALVKLCGGLPLALCIVGAHLSLEASEQGGLTDVASYITKLEGARLATLDADASQGDQVSISATLRLSEQSLSSLERDAWHRLSIFPADWDAAAATAVTGVSADACESLYRRSLLERIGDRYRFHDIVRDFALARLQEKAGECQETHYRHAGHYISVLQQISRCYAEGGGSIISALELFDKEWSNIEAGQQWAHDQAKPDPRAAQLCIDYPSFGFNALDLRQHPRTQIHWLETALLGIECLNRSERINREKKSQTLHNLGLAHSNLGDMPQAIGCFERALPLMIALKNKFHEAICRGNCGWAYHKSGQSGRAFELYEQGIEVAQQIAEEQKRDKAMANLLGNKGIAHKDREEYEPALTCYNGALKAARRNKDQWTEGKILGNIGVIYDLTHDYPRAIEQYEDQFTIAEAMSDRRGQASALFNKAISISNLQDIKQAIEIAETALELNRSFSDPMVGEVEETLAAWRSELEKG